MHGSVNSLKSLTALPDTRKLQFRRGHQERPLGYWTESVWSRIPPLSRASKQAEEISFCRFHVAASILLTRSAQHPAAYFDEALQEELHQAICRHGWLNSGRLEVKPRTSRRNKTPTPHHPPLSPVETGPRGKKRPSGGKKRQCNQFGSPVNFRTVERKGASTWPLAAENFGFFAPWPR